MKIERTWHINEPNTTSGYSTSLTITYSSFDKNEIDAINTVLMSCDYMDGVKYHSGAEIQDDD